MTERLKDGTFVKLGPSFDHDPPEKPRTFYGRVDRAGSKIRGLTKEAYQVGGNSGWDVVYRNDEIRTGTGRKITVLTEAEIFELTFMLLGEPPLRYAWD